MRPLALLALLLLAGCSAQMVNRPGSADASAYAPVNERERPGVVRYLNQGMASVVKKRRENAYKQMYEACGGPYRIDAEGAEVRDGVVVAVDPDVAVMMQSEYWHIQFSCVRS